MHMGWYIEIPRKGVNIMNKKFRKYVYVHVNFCPRKITFRFVALSCDVFLSYVVQIFDVPQNHTLSQPSNISECRPYNHITILSKFIQLYMPQLTLTKIRKSSNLEVQDVSIFTIKLLFIAT